MADDADVDENDAWRRRTKYLYSGRVGAYDELRDEVETEAAGPPPTSAPAPAYRPCVPIRRAWRAPER
jgi:hypothetical protein